MMIGARIDNISDGKFKTYHHCLAAIQCNPPRIECFLGHCKYCPGVDDLREDLERCFDEQMIDQIQFRQ